jgi:hypothetical protein
MEAPEDSRQMVLCHPTDSIVCWTLDAECCRKPLAHRTITALWFLGTEEGEQGKNLSLDAMIQSPGHLYTELKEELILK